MNKILENKFFYITIILCFVIIFQFFYYSNQVDRLYTIISTKNDEIEELNKNIEEKNGIIEDLKNSINYLDDNISNLDENIENFQKQDDAIDDNFNYEFTDGPV